MSLLVVAVLSLLWLGFFLPSLLQARRMSSPYASATSFQDSLRRLGEVPRPHGRPSAAAVAKARRRETLAVLSAAVIGGALIAVGFGGWAMWAVLPPAVALSAYVVVLRRAVRRRVRRAQARRASLPALSAPVSQEVDPPHVNGHQADADEPGIVPSVGRRSRSHAPERMAG